MKGDTRCVEGRLMRHDPQFDDPDLETDIGECPECEGKGHNCADCAASHAEECWEDYAPYRSRSMTEGQIKYMVDRFLAWRLPKPWNPDNGISYQRPNYAHEPADHDWPTGTNLFDASQAEAMIRYMIKGLPDWLSHE